MYCFVCGHDCKYFDLFDYKKYLKHLAQSYKNYLPDSLNCNKCNQSFTNSNSLKTHIQKSHSCNPAKSKNDVKNQQFSGV